MFSAQDLAVESKKIQLKDADYSVGSQTRFNVTNDALSITWNGTQTYSSNGRPSDSDNDQ